MKSLSAIGKCNDISNGLNKTLAQLCIQATQCAVDLRSPNYNEVVVIGFSSKALGKLWGLYLTEIEQSLVKELFYCTWILTELN